MPEQIARLRSEALNPLFEATVQGVEEAVVNALVAARTRPARTTGRLLPYLTTSCRECFSDTKCCSRAHSHTAEFGYGSVRIQRERA